MNLYIFNINSASILKPPVIYFQVNSLDYWDRHRCEGYGQLTLPTNPGSYKIELQTYRAIGSITDEMKRFFIGGGSTFSDKKCIGIGSNSSNYSKVTQNIQY